MGLICGCDCAVCAAMTFPQQCCQAHLVAPDAERTAALVSALEFYADAGRYEENGVLWASVSGAQSGERVGWYRDKGQTARAALAAYRQAHDGSSSSGAEGGGET